MLPLEGGEARELVKRKRAVAACEPSPDGRYLAFLAPDEPTEDDERREKERDDPDVYGERWKYGRLHLLDLASSAVTTLPTGDVHVYDLAWSPDGRAVAYLACATPDLDDRERSRLYVVEVESPTPRRLASTNGHTFGLTWSGDGARILYVSATEPTPQSSFAVFTTDPTDGTSKAVGPAADEPACGLEVSPVPADSRVVVAIARGLSTALEWLDPTTGERADLFAYPAGDVGPFAVGTRQGETVLAAVLSSGDSPPELFVGPPDHLQPVTDHGARLEGYPFGRQEAFYWTAPDGLALDGLLIRPQNPPTTPRPTVVLVHGGPYGRWEQGWNLHWPNWAQLLALRGYAVLLPNPRGGMGHGNAFAKAALGDVGGADFRDVMSMVDAAIERGIADPDRLAIGGWSQGGFMTAWAVSQTTRFRAGVMGAGPSDWGMMTLTSDMPTFEAALGGDKPWDGPGPHRADQLSPISFARAVRTPLLILHGRDDRRVPVSQAIGFHRALREVGVPVELVIYPREGHGIAEREHQRDLLRRVVAWLDRWMPPGD